MSDQNINISNGTCYTAPGKKLDSSFIPCGNDAFGHQTCCGAGDNCLADNACWGQHGSGYGSSLTYMAGCTDPEYKDPSCPKKYIDQPWIALTRCDDKDTEWAVCPQKGDPTTLRPGSYCSCTVAASTTIAVKDSATLASIASLPKGTGDSIKFFAGHSPTPASGGTTAEGQGPGSTEGGGATPTGSTPSSPNSAAAAGNTDASAPGQSSTGSGLGTGAKVGIGVGIALGVLILLAAIAALLLRRRRRRRIDSEIAEKRTSAASTVPTLPEADGQAVSEADGKAARPWSMRSELEGSIPADNPAGPTGKGQMMGDPKWSYAMRRMDLAPVAELPGSESWHQPDT